jgi:hypothetical protein
MVEPIRPAPPVTRTVESFNEILSFTFEPLF